MRKVLRRTKPRSWIAILINIIIILLCIVTSLIILRIIKDDYELELKNAREELESHISYCYEARQDIKAGQIIREEDLNYVEIYSSQGKNYYINDHHFGMVSKIDIRKGTFLLQDMLVDDINVGNLREIEYNVLSPSSNLNDSDYVDIRILFPNGEDYIVLSKKNLKNLNPETGRCFYGCEMKLIWLGLEIYMYPEVRFIQAVLQSHTRFNKLQANPSSLNHTKEHNTLRILMTR